MSRLQFFAAVVACLFFVVGCGSWPKKNAPRTSITSHSEPVTGFSASGPRHQDTDFLSFDELKCLARDSTPGGTLEQKLERFFRRPIISNEAWFEDRRPNLARNEFMGEFLRVATWNIRQSRHALEAARVMSSAAAFEELIDPRVAPPGSAKRDELRRERERLATADVILLQEMDIGIGRSGYRDAARDIASAMGMNYAYAPQQLEIDPVLLGLESRPDGGSRGRPPDPARYKGVFGLAVLSRYPIKNARCFQLRTQPYDWFAGERAETDPLEDSRRFATELVFENKMVREMKVGGRIFFRVDLEVPGLPGDTLTVIHNHLEIKALPQGREAQLAEILSHIRDIPHTVVMAGDHNTSRLDLSPTSTLRVLARTSTDSQTWLAIGTNLLMSVPAVLNSARILLNNLKNLHSPLALDIPVVLPNETRRMFHQIEEFRFSDGGRFDFRGDPARSINRSSALLANSNEKAVKGHRTTFSVRRPVGPLGRGRLDWIFVKAPPSARPRGEQSYRLAPHYGETLPGLVEDLTLRLSDHSPCVVDIPLREPPGIPAREIRSPRPFSAGPRSFARGGRRN